MLDCLQRKIPFPSFLKILLISTKKRITLSTSPFRISRFICLLNNVVSPILSLIHLLFSSSNVFSVDFVLGFLHVKEDCSFFSFFQNPLIITKIKLKCYFSLIYLQSKICASSIRITISRFY